MEWVQTTGDTVDEAKDRALDELGVDEQDAEFDVLDEPRSGLFGRVRGEARVKARVRPAEPRAKSERRDRGRGKRKGKGKGKAEGGPDRDGGADRSARDQADGNGGPATKDKGAGGDRPRGRRSGGGQRRPTGRGRSGGGPRSQSDQDTARKDTTMTEDVAIDEQGEIVAGFLEGLLEAFGAEGEVVQEQVDDSTLELRVEGDDLGLLIGPRGATLTAVHEMCRTVLQREVAGGARARIRVDIGGYRERRRQALAEFARTQAVGVVEDQTSRALEPMGAADRKVIHDTVNDIDGVRTISEGEDPKRRVVLVPDDD